MKPINCAVIGVGYLGKFHAQKYAELEHANLVAVCDIDANTATDIAKQHQVQAVTDYQTLVGKIDAASIVTPTSHHFEVAKFLLQNGIHVLVEKPITTTLAQADELIALAKQNHCILQVGHLERFNAAVLALEGQLNQPLFIESHRIAPFKPRGTDVNVILDLMIHDIDIIQNIVHSPVAQIDANGSHILSSNTDIANARIRFENGCVANITASRVGFKSERKMRIFQNDAYISIDFENKKLGVYKKGDGELYPGIPDIVGEDNVFENNDPIKLEIAAFIECINTGSLPIVTGEDGRNALATAIKISELMQHNSEATPI